VGHPALSVDEKTLYFVSDMSNGYGLTDIYKVSVSEDHKEDGTYSFDISTCEVGNYTLRGEKLDYKPDTKNFQTKLVTDKNNITKIDLNLELTPLIIGNQIVINPIYFDFDKSFIREDAKYELENIVTVMNNHPEMIIKMNTN